MNPFEEDKVKHSQDNSFNFSLPNYNFTVDLPSKGLYYTQEHPLYSKEYIELKHVTGKEEAILTNKDYIRKGIVLDKFIQALFVDQRLIFPNIYGELLLNDKFAILLAARINAYSNQYKTGVTCPKCKQDSIFSFDLSNHKSSNGYYDLSNEEQEKITKLANNAFRVKLPQCELNISLKLLSIKEEQEIIKKSKKLKNKDDSLTFKEQFIDVLIDIEGNTSFEAKDYFLDRVPAIDLFYIRTISEKLNPKINLEQDFTCPHCEYETTEFTMPITESFLFPHLNLGKS